jgi:intraflagellar transport protein 122
MSGGDTDKTSLLMKQAEWANRNSEPRVAAELYINAKNYGKAIEFAGRHGWADLLLDIVRKLDKADTDLLNKCAEFFKQLNQLNFAAEVYEKMGNIDRLLELRMESHQWEEVFVLAEKYQNYKITAYYGYAQWLAENDRFEEAEEGASSGFCLLSSINKADLPIFVLFKAFKKAGFQKEAIKVLEQLTVNAVNEERFDDAGYYYLLLSTEYLQIMAGNRTIIQ